MEFQVTVYSWPGTKDYLLQSAVQAQYAIQYLQEKLSLNYPLKKYGMT